jgi:outer membrane lipoprotein SlyB
MDLRTRAKRALARARYAAVGAAVGAAIGGLFGRSTASTGGATGALVGALVAEKRYSAGGWLDQIRADDAGAGDDADERSVGNRLSGAKETLSRSS